MSVERRRDPRFAIEQIVEVSFGRETFVRGTGINISRTGILCASESYLEPAAQVSLQMTIEIGSRIHRFNCEGIVVRTDEVDGTFRSGISFTAIEETDARKLAAFLKRKDRPSKRG